MIISDLNQIDSFQSGFLWCSIQMHFGKNFGQNLSQELKRLLSDFITVDLKTDRKVLSMRFLQFFLAESTFLKILFDLKAV